MQKPANMVLNQQSSNYPVATYSTLCACLMCVATALDVPSVLNNLFLILDIKRLSESWNKGLLSGIDGDGCEEHDDDDHDDFFFLTTNLPS